jgi:hypothetical protein
MSAARAVRHCVPLEKHKQHVLRGALGDELEARCTHRSVLFESALRCLVPSPSLSRRYILFFYSRRFAIVSVMDNRDYNSGLKGRQRASEPAGYAQTVDRSSPPHDQQNSGGMRRKSSVLEYELLRISLTDASQVKALLWRALPKWSLSNSAMPRGRRGDRKLGKSIRNVLFRLSDLANRRALYAGTIKAVEHGRFSSFDTYSAPSAAVHPWPYG